jgi:hypothetical protein
MFYRLLIKQEKLKAKSSTTSVLGKRALPADMTTPPRHHADAGATAQQVPLSRTLGPPFTPPADRVGDAILKMCEGLERSSQLLARAMLLRGMSFEDGKRALLLLESSSDHSGVFAGPASGSAASTGPTSEQ